MVQRIDWFRAFVFFWFVGCAPQQRFQDELEGGREHVAQAASALVDGPGWQSLSDVPGIDGVAYALLAGPAGEMYVGGAFAAAGSVLANNVAKWDGQTWSTLGSGTDGSVRALAFDAAGNLYAGGEFTTAGGVAAPSVAKWDGHAWSALGSGMAGGYSTRVNALAFDGNGALYAAGDFTSAGGTPANYIAKWQNGVWSALAGGGLQRRAYALVADKAGAIYVGGEFGYAGDVEAPSLAKWDGTSWSAVGTTNTSIFPTVYALAVDPVSGDLLAGGDGGDVLMRWNGSNWSEPGGGGLAGDTVDAIAVAPSGNVYVSGQLPIDLGLGFVAQLSGSTWNLLTPSPADYPACPVSALALDTTGRLYAGGTLYSTAGHTGLRGVARWSGSAWVPLGRGIDDDVFALAIDGSNVYAAGKFQSLPDGTTQPYPVVAQYGANGWSTLGTFPSATIDALATDGRGRLYVGGRFSSVDGVTADNLAVWDGSTWASVGTGLNGEVHALAVDAEGSLYAGGNFTALGDYSGTYNFVAKWQNGFWSSLGNGFQNPVYALATRGADVYVGGQAGIGHWDGTTWVAPYSSMTANAIAVDASGRIFAATPAIFATFDGSAWSYSTVAAAAVNDVQIGALVVTPVGDVILGGRFDGIGDVAAPNLARLSNGTWSSVEGGPNGFVAALAVDAPGNLYVGGLFSTAGSVVSNDLARYAAASSSAGAGGTGGTAGSSSSSGAASNVAGSAGTAGNESAGSPGSGAGGNAEAGANTAGDAGSPGEAAGGAGRMSNGGTAGGSSNPTGGGGAAGNPATITGGKPGAGGNHAAGSGQGGMTAAGGRGAAAGSAGVTRGGNTGAEAHPNTGSGCACHAANEPASPANAAVGLGLIACLALRRRKRLSRRASRTAASSAGKLP